jgi:transposase
MTAQIQVITLDSQQRQQLEGMLRRGRWTPRQLMRARILLMADDQKEASNSTIAQALSCGRETARLIRHRFLTEGLTEALNDRPRPGQPKKLTGEDEAFVIATACTDPPKGSDHWTLKLLKEKLKSKKRKEVSVSPIRRALLKSQTKPWLKKNVVHSQDNR